MDWINKLELCELKVKILNMILNIDVGDYYSDLQNVKDDLIELVAFIDNNEPKVKKINRNSVE